MRRAMEEEPILSFTNPEPIKRIRQVASRLELQRRARGGIDPGKRRVPDAVIPRQFIDEGAAPGVDTPSDDEVTVDTFPVPVDETPVSPVDAAPPTAAPVVAVPGDPVPVPETVPLDPGGAPPLPVDPGVPVAPVVS